MTFPHGLSPRTQSAPHADSNHHPERDQLLFIINRAYQNIYGLGMPACADYQKTIFDAALALRRDARSQHFTDKAFIQICEDIIRISDEHARLARQHQSRASNPVYLRETALDNAIEKEKYLRAIGAHKPVSTVTQTSESVQRLSFKSEGRMTSAEVMELAYQQLSISTLKS